MDYDGLKRHLEKGTEVHYGPIPPLTRYPAVPPQRDWNTAGQVFFALGKRKGLGAAICALDQISPLVYHLAATEGKAPSFEARCEMLIHHLRSYADGQVKRATVAAGFYGARRLPRSTFVQAEFLDAIHDGAMFVHSSNNNWGYTCANGVVNRCLYALWESMGFNWGDYLRDETPREVKALIRQTKLDFMAEWRGRVESKYAFADVRKSVLT